MSAENNTEIERKFLVKYLPDNLNSYPCHEISQAYISTSPTLRIRKRDNEYIFTFKAGKGIKKTEFEYNLTYEEYNNLLKKTETNQIIKKRYIIPLEGGLLAELDIYSGFLEGFINVEVEFGSTEKAEAFIPPDWFGKEVTNRREYTNSMLSINGIPKDYDSASFGK